MGDTFNVKRALRFGDLAQLVESEINDALKEIGDAALEGSEEAHVALRNYRDDVGKIRAGVESEQLKPSQAELLLTTTRDTLRKSLLAIKNEKLREAVASLGERSLGFLSQILRGIFGALSK